MVVKFRLLLIISLVSLTIQSQRLVDTWKTNKEHTSYLGSESVNPFIINQIQIPINTKTEASLSLSLKSNSGNTMIHKIILTNKYGGSREIEFDAIIEKNAIYFSYPFHKKLEVFMELSLNSASRKGIYNPMNWIVQDAFIEKIHIIAGKSDPFKRKRIETLFSQLCDQFMIRRNYAKTFQGFKTRILSKLTSLTIIQFINKFVFDRNINNIKISII